MLLTFSRAAGGRPRSARAGESAERERARLQAVARFADPGAPALAAAVRGAQIAATLLDAGVGLCTLVDRRRVRVLGAVGLDGTAELPLESGLCLATVASGGPGSWSAPTSTAEPASIPSSAARPACARMRGFRS